MTLRVDLYGPPGSGKTLAAEAIKRALAGKGLSYEIKEHQGMCYGDEIHYSTETIVKPAKRKPRLAQPKFEAVIQTPDSNWIDHVQYDPDRRIMEAQTKAGARYRYREVDTHTFAKVVTSAPPGKAFNTFVKGQFRSTKLHR